MGFLKLYRDANWLWHLNKLDKHLNAVCEPLKIENTCAKDIIKDYTFKERGRLDN